MTQTMKSTFTLPNGSESPPVETVRGESESLTAWRDRHVAALTAAWQAAWE